jgi:N-acetyl-gamma-glutamyl-phosphate reductase
MVALTSAASRPVRVAIVGASGYAAGELIRILSAHPFVQLDQIVSISAAGKLVGEHHPHLNGVSQAFFTAQLTDPVDLVFCCGRHGDSMSAIGRILEKTPESRVIDLSGDFRLRDPKLYPKWYRFEHTAPDLLRTFVYGLTEWSRNELTHAARVANPGCFATAIGLALAPLAQHAIGTHVTISALTGSSGSGSTPGIRTHHPTRAQTVRSYRPLRHQHTPEVAQFLRNVGNGADPSFSFVATSGPFVRGIYSIAQFRLPDGCSAGRIESCYEGAYRRCGFVRLRSEPPDLQVVVGSNFCDLYLEIQGRDAVVITTLDNLIKGAAGQAVQNMNVMMGWPETTGLGFVGSYP